MSDPDLYNQFELSSGNYCRLLRIRKDFIPNYYILAFPKTQGEPSPQEVSEMLKLGTFHAQKLAKEVKVKESKVKGKEKQTRKRIRN